MTENKILIYVQDGTVQAVYSSSDAKIIIIDHDRHGKESGFISEVLEPDAIMDNMHELFSDVSSPIDAEIKEELKRLKF